MVWCGNDSMPAYTLKNNIVFQCIFRLKKISKFSNKLKGDYMELGEVLVYAASIGIGVMVFMYRRGHFNKFF